MPVRSSEETVEFSEQIDLSEADEGYPGGEKELKDSAGSHIPKILVQIDQETDSSYANTRVLRCQRGQPCRDSVVSEFGYSREDRRALIGQIGTIPAIRAG